MNWRRSHHDLELIPSLDWLSCSIGANWFRGQSSRGQRGCWPSGIFWDLDRSKFMNSWARESNAPNHSYGGATRGKVRGGNVHSPQPQPANSRDPACSGAPADCRQGWRLSRDGRRPLPAPCLKVDAFPWPQMQIPIGRMNKIAG